jgi:hypothetical protein
MATTADALVSHCPAEGLARYDLRLEWERTEIYCLGT